MCLKAHKYTSGAAFTCSDVATAKACATRTYEAAVELFAMLCQKYNLNPLADGVIISHKEGHTRGVASNHGDPDHLWRQLGMSYTMDTFRKAVKDKMSGATTEEKPQEVTKTQGTAFLNLSTADAVAKIGKLCQPDYSTKIKKTDSGVYRTNESDSPKTGPSAVNSTMWLSSVSPGSL